MSNGTSGPDGCPLCEKPVMGRTALLGHLEFGHDIADPEAYLASIEQPGTARKRSRPGGAGGATRVLAVVLLLMALAAAGWYGSQELLADDDAEVAADATDDDPSERTTTTTTASAPTAVPQTTAAPTTTTTTTTTTATTGDEELPFRAPFLDDAETTGCTTQGDVDVHEFRFRFSGARNITFDGVFYPDETGNGERTSTHELPSGSTTYLDRVVVLDPSGGEHHVEISPPLYLGSC